jgi:hypothetical protein
MNIFRFTRVCECCYVCSDRADICPECGEFIPFETEMYGEDAYK